MELVLKTIVMRLVEERDADFILSLRLDKGYNRFLSEVSPDLDAQKEWIRNYKYEEAAGRQYYFIIERKDGTPCGTVRLYDFRSDSFSWGSWILNSAKTRYAAIESALLVYEFGFEHLGFSQSHFEVMKGNDGVVSFHKRMGAVVTEEDDVNFYFQITRNDVSAAKADLLRKLVSV